MPPCMYCLARLAPDRRRCPDCDRYITDLLSSDDQAARDYGAQLVDLAAERYTAAYGPTAFIRAIQQAAA